MHSGSHRQTLELVARFEPYLGSGDEALRGWVERHRAEAFYALDRPTEALAASRRAVELAKSRADPLAAAEALALEGRISWWLRDMAGSAAAATEALDMIEPLDSDESVARIFAGLARLLALARDPKAAAVAERALDIAETVGSRQSVALAQMALGLAGDLDGLTDRMLAAIREARAAGDGPTEALATTNLATALAFSHRYDEAEQWLPRARELAERFEQSAAVSVSTGLGPWVRAMRGDLQAALDGFADYDEVIEEENQRAWGSVHRAVILARLARTDEAVDRLQLAEGHRIGRALDPVLVFEAAAVEVRWLAGVDFDGERIRDEVLLQNLHAFPQDYLGRLGRGLQRAGFDVPVLSVGVGAYDLAMAGRCREAAALWASLGNPYESGVELSLAGDERGRKLLDQIGALGAVRRLWPEHPPG
jgi:tetratricopeptide (TPR) repeat protein